MKMKNNGKAKLPDLPPSSDRNFWGGEVEIIEWHEKARCAHGGNLTERNKTAYCINCGAGWNLDGRDRILDGHLYRDGLKIF